MPDNIGDMFYTGAAPWHEKGQALVKPATLEEALKAGGLNWAVGDADLLTAMIRRLPFRCARRSYVLIDLPGMNIAC